DNNLPPGTLEEERIALMQAAEILISTRLTIPVPASNDYRLAVDGKREAFETKRNALIDLVDRSRDTLAQLLADAEAQREAAGVLPPLSDFDLDPLDFSDEHTQIV